MPDREPDDRPFRELRGDYAANAGQQINVPGYLDYFEPLGSALSRLPDGSGGPFLYEFAAGGGRTIGSLGWVVSAASKRFGGWTLWGMWAERPIPAVALPLFWPALSDPDRAGEIVSRANDSAAELFDRGRWRSLLREIKTTRLRDSAFALFVRTELARAWSVPAPHRQPIEVELTPRMLDLLPWLYLFGPVDPGAAQLQPSRFNGAGYQYILSERLPERETDVPREIDDIVDAAAGDLPRALAMANDLRARRGGRKPAAPPQRSRTVRREEDEMPTKTPAARQPQWTPMVIWNLVFQILVLTLLGWIAWNANAIRKAMPPARPVEPATVTSTAAAEPAAPPPAVPASQPETVTESPDARAQRLAIALATRPPQGIRVSAALRDAQADGVARAAVEIFLRRNGCFHSSEAVDGQFSAAELKAVRSCAALRKARLVTAGGQIDADRAIAWLEHLLS